MTKNQLNQFNMLKGTDAFLILNRAVVDTVPAFGLCADDLNAKIPEIERKDIEAKNAGLGNSEVKENAEDEMINAAVLVARPLKVYGRKSGNMELKNIASVTFSSLQHLREDECLQRVKNISAAAAGVVTVAADYGIVQPVIDDLNAKITAYEEADADLDTGMAEKSALLKERNALMKEAMAILREELDMFAEMFKSSNSEFYNGYKAATVIVDV